jgi:hypothetical protein
MAAFFCGSICVVGVCGSLFGVGVCGSVFGVLGFCGLGSWALKAQKPPIANEKLSIINDKIFLAIIFLPCSYGRTHRIGGAFAALIQQGVG